MRDEATARYARLRKDVSAAGILDRDYGYYALLIFFILGGLALCLFLVIRLPLSGALLLAALGLAFVTVQACGIVHDAGHRAIFRSTARNNVLGEAFAALVAMGFDSWRLQHNAHHAHTNVEGADPDLDVPLHAFTVSQIQREQRPWRYVRRYQAFVFIPMRVFVVVTRRLVDLKYFREQPVSVALVAKVLLWLIGLGLWFVAPFLLFPLAKALLLLTTVHLAIGFYLSNIFAPNHKGMPHIDKDSTASFMEQQIVTSRNVKAGWLTDVIYLGLNYQIEHHLFPTCPRNKLKQLTPYVMAVCEELGIPFTETGVMESNRIIIRELNRVAQAPAA